MLCSLCQFDNSVQSSRCRACGSPLAASSSATAQTPDALPTGATLIGTYVVESVLGQGGFGITYRCHDQMLDRRVAVKEFFPSGCRRQGAGVEASRGQSANDYREARAQFLAEARVLARCHHRGIVGVHTAFEANQTAYMVMELLHGKSLAQLLDARGGRMNEAEAVAVIERAGEALGFVHEQELLHRDIKPDNIMMCDDGRVMLIDFGTAREYVKGQAQGHTIVVTPGYAPLEQYAKQARRGAFTDIYSLAATLYHLLTGQMPPAASDRAMGVMLRPVRELNPQISASVARAVEAALQMEVAKRPRSVREFLDAMKAPAESSKFETSPAMERAITRANSAENEDPNDEESRAWSAALSPDAIRARQQSLGSLTPSVNPQPVKIAPYSAAPPAPPVASAPPAPALYSSGNVGYNNNSNHDDTTKLLRWFFGAVLFIGFGVACLSGSGGSKSNSNPYPSSSSTTYGSSKYQSSSPSSYSSQTSESENSRKRAEALRAWNALPVLSPVSTVALPFTKSPTKSTSNQSYKSGSAGVEFSPDGKRLAYIDNQAVLRVVSVPDRELIRTLKLDESSDTLAVMFSPDNKTLAVVQGQYDRASQRPPSFRVRVWNLRNGKSLKTFVPESGKTAWLQAVTNEGKLLLNSSKSSLSESASPELFLWSAKTGERSTTPISDLVGLSYGVLSPDGKEFAAGNNQGVLQRINSSTGARAIQHYSFLKKSDYVAQFGDKNALSGEDSTSPLGVRGIDYSLNGSYLASRDDARISVFNSEKREIGALTIDGKSSMFFSMSPDGKWLAARGALPYSPEGNLLWNVKTGQKIRLQAPSENLLDFGFSQDGKQLYGIFAASEGLQFVTWQTDATPVTSYNVIESTQFQREFASQLSTDAVAAVSKTGKLLAIPREPAIEIYQPTGTLVNKLFVGSPKPKVIEFSPDDALLAFEQRNGDASDVEVWSWKGTPLRVASFKSERPATALAFSPDGKSLVFGDEKGAVRWYDIGTKKLKAQVNAGQGALALGIADRTLTVLGRRKIKTYQWPLRDESEPRRVEPTSVSVLSNPSSALHLAMSADGKLLATAQANDRPQLWNLAKGSLLQPLPPSEDTDSGAANQVYGLTFSADGTRLTGIAQSNGRADEMFITTWSRPKAK